MDRNGIIKVLNLLNDKYKNEGFKLVSLFGSYARGTEDEFSDIDLTYEIDHNVFYRNDGFAKILRLEEIKNELENTLHKKVDIIPANTKNLLLRKNLDKEQIIL